MNYCKYNSVINKGYYKLSTYEEINYNSLFKIYIKPYLFTQYKYDLKIYIKVSNHKFYDVETEEKIDIDNTIPNFLYFPKMYNILFDFEYKIIKYLDNITLHDNKKQIIRFRKIKNKFYIFTGEWYNASNSDLKIINNIKNQYLTILIHIIKKYKLRIKYLWYIILDDIWWF